MGVKKVVLKISFGTYYRIQTVYNVLKFIRSFMGSLRISQNHTHMMKPN